MQPIINMSEEDRAMDTCSLHKKFGKDSACGSGDILADRQTHRQTYSSQYFAIAATGEVKNSERLRNKYLFFVGVVLTSPADNAYTWMQMPHS